MLITPTYAAEQVRLHAVDPRFGAEGFLWAYQVAGIAALTGCRSILDYGCGKGTLAKAMPGFDVREYDPGVPGKEKTPEPADLVACLDVLEHIEPECLNEVMADLRRVTRKHLFAVVTTKPSGRIMSDGRDTHICTNVVWPEMFKAYGFTIRQVWNNGLRQWVALMDSAC